MPAQNKPSKPGYFCVGVILGAHGIRGEVVVKPFTEDPLNLTAYGVPVDQTGAPFAFSGLRVVKRGVIARLKGVADRTAAEKLKGTALFAPVENLPELEEGEAWYSELEGLPVLRENGEKIGTIEYAFDAGAQTNLNLRTSKGKEVVLPWVDGVISHFDRAQQHLVAGPDVDMYLSL